MSGREDSRRQQTAGRASIFGDSSDAVVHVRAASLEELLRADAYNARRERDLLATKVALLAYKLQMNSQERRHHHHHHHRQVCQASLCGRLVWRGMVSVLRACLRYISVLTRVRTNCYEARQQQQLLPV